MSRVYKDYGNVRILSVDDDLIIQRFIEYNDQGWTDIRTFNRRSDDYAISNATYYAEALLAEIEEIG